MQRVADAEGDAAHELAVDQRRVHGTADVGADHDSAQGDGAGLGIDVDHHGRRAARVGHLRHLERGAGGKAPLARQLGKGDALAPSLQGAVRVRDVALGHAPALGCALPRLGDQLRRREMRGIAGGDGAARAIGAHTAFDGGGVGVAHVEPHGRNAERLAQDLRQHGLEPRAHGRSARVDDEGSVGARLHLRGFEGAEARLLDVDREPDPAAWARRPRVHRSLLGARPGVVQTAQELVEEGREVAGVVDGAGAERLRATVVGHLVRADQVAAAQVCRIDSKTRGGPVQEALADAPVPIPDPGASPSVRRSHGRLPVP